MDVVTILTAKMPLWLEATLMAATPLVPEPSIAILVSALAVVVDS
jgi:hypothetical protein